MKLILCKKCHDVVKLDYRLRRCKCKKSWGKYYPDGLNAIIGGDHCVPLGFANSSLVDAVYNQPEKDWGREFVAFVIERECPTIEVSERRDYYVRRARKVKRA